MNSKTLVGLLIAAAALGGITALVMQHNDAAVEAVAEKQTLFPDLAAKKNDVATLRVQRKDGSYTLHRVGDGWGVQEKGDFPVQMENVRKTILALADMKVIEAKTSDKLNYDKLGVQDFDAPDSKSVLVTLSDSAGKDLARLIVGKEHEGKGGPANQLYVRKAGEPQSWLVDGKLELHEKAADWMQKEIVKIPQDRVKSVEVRQPEGETLLVDRDKSETRDFTLHDIPEGKEPTYATAANSLASGLEYVNLDDVSPASDIDFTKGTGPIARFATFDGLVVTVTTKDQDGKSWANFSASYEEPPAAAGPEPTPAADAEKDKDKDKDAAAKPGDPPKPAKKSPDEVKKEVADINARTSKWAYQISSYSRSLVGKKKSELIKDKAPPAPPPGATAPPGATTPPAGGKLSSDGQPMVIPDTLDPAIQDAIKKDLESKGEKYVIGPGKPAGDAKPAPDKDAKPAEGTGDQKPPHR